MPPAKRRRTLQMLLVFVTLVLVINALVGERGLMETLRARKQHQELVPSIERLRSENARLRDEARRLRSDPGTIEALARQELGLIKPGEMLFIIKDAKSGEPVADLRLQSTRQGPSSRATATSNSTTPKLPCQTRQRASACELVGVDWDLDLECLGTWDLELGSCRVAQHFCMQNTRAGSPMPWRTCHETSSESPLPIAAVALCTSVMAQQPRRGPGPAGQVPGAAPGAADARRPAARLHLCRD